MFMSVMFRCNNARDCDIRAESDNFGGDPCPGTGKYLEVYFGCFPGKFNLLCCGHPGPEVVLYTIQSTVVLINRYFSEIIFAC